MSDELFDLVVIGAGSAGAVIASRASEDPRRSVLLVEAGPDYADTAQTPFDLVNSHNNSYTAHDWNFSYQPTNLGASRPFPRGRVTGGSSAVNTTIALRGMPEDYDGWAAAGNPEWAWKRCYQPSSGSNATSTTAISHITVMPARSRFGDTSGTS